MFLVASTYPLFAVAQTYYVDATGGSDNNNGLSPSTAWQTINKVNVSTFAPGSSILFKKGETFRGSLVTSSGSPSGYITYGAYGSGSKPKLLGSRQRSSPLDWVDVGNNIWRTTRRPMNLVGSELLPNPEFSDELLDWGLWNNPSSGASSTFSRTTTEGEYYTPPGGGKFVCINNGDMYSDIQLLIARWPIAELKWYRFAFKAKATQSFTLPEGMISFQQENSPWASYTTTSSPPLSITATWASYEIYYKANTTADDCRITFFLGNLIPDGAMLFIDSLSLRECDANPDYLDVDVGNLVFNDEMSCGIKVWEEQDLNAQGKFWYDEDNDLLELYSISNPGNYYSNIEFCLYCDIINVSFKSYIICDSLDLRYGANGIWGMNSDHIVIKNCDLSFLGGADQYGGSGTTRMGNGITFWNGAHDIIVERCTFNQIYDAAISPQGIDDAGFEVYNLYFRNNIIRNCEYSFEYWERYELVRAHDIYFENNTCLNAGGGWSHSQRPDPNGSHLMFYSNPSQSERIYIRNNIFFNSTDWGVRWLRNEDVNKVILDHNCWYESSGRIAWVDNTFYDYISQWESYKAATGQDAHSIRGNPLLNSDHTLQASSPCIDAGFTLGTVTEDYSGVERPQGSGYDIGAFEASAALLAAPGLITPADGMIKVSINPDLSWRRVARAVKYSVMVSLTPDFSAIIVTTTEVVDTAKSIGPLQYNTTYYWRVCSKNDRGTSEWSPTRSFVTMTAQDYVPPRNLQPLTKGYYLVQFLNTFSTSLYDVVTDIRGADSVAALLNLHSVSGVEYNTLWYHPADMAACIAVAKELQLRGIDLWLATVSDSRVAGFNNDVFPSQYRAYSMTAEGSIVPALVYTVSNDSVPAFDAMNPEAMDWLIGRFKELVLEPLKPYTNGYFFDEDCRFYANTPGQLSSMRIDYYKLAVYSDAVLAQWQKYCVDHSVTYSGTIVSKFPVHLESMVANGGGKTEYYPGYNVPEIVEPGTPLISLPRNTGVWAAWDDFVTSLYVESWLGRLSKAVHEVNAGNPNFKGVVYFALHNWSLAYEEITDPAFYVDDVMRWMPWGTQRGVTLSKVCSLPAIDYVICETYPPIRANLYKFASEYQRICSEHGKGFGLMVHRDDGWGLDGQDKETDRWEMIQYFQPTIVARYPIHRLSPQNQYSNGEKETLFDQRMAAYRPASPFPPALISPVDQANDVQITPTLVWGSCVGASMYHLQVSLDPTFSRLIVDNSTVPPASVELDPLSNGTTYYWRVRGMTTGGASDWSSTSSFTTVFAPNSIEQVGSAIPKVYKLSQNYPNPFNSATNIRFALPKKSIGTLCIYDLLGRNVATLVSGELEAGYYSVRWNAIVSSGIYFYRLKAEEISTSSAQVFVQTKKFIVLK